MNELDIDESISNEDFYHNLVKQNMLYLGDDIEFTALDSVRKN